MKTLRAFFPLSPRGTSGERAGERGKNSLLSPALSSFFGEEREKGTAAAVQANYLPNNYWRDARRYAAKHILVRSGNRDGDTPSLA